MIMCAKGFTLIELLIVVAIIAILAAIAVPNFLEAQTRSKVSRVKADMRSLATVIESYRTDYNTYHPPGQYYNPDDTYLHYGPIYGAWWLYIEWTGPRGPQGGPNPQGNGVWLTTPVSYITNIPIDPFTTSLLNTQARRDWGMPGVNTASVLYGRRLNGALSEYPPGWDPPIHKDVGYFMSSVGPGLELNYHPPYDPTNGTVSRGDIVYLGLSIGSYQ